MDILFNKEVLIENNIIIEIEDNFNSHNCNIIDAEQCILTPGFIDSHTHPIFIGNRSNEFKMRLNGSSYEDINNAGGGILSSIKNLKEASFDQLYK